MRNEVRRTWVCLGVSPAHREKRHELNSEFHDFVVSAFPAALSGILMRPPRAAKQRQVSGNSRNLTMG
jgi:hypothetical protein